MIMNGLMRKFNYEEYYKQLETMPDPIMASELPNSLMFCCRNLSKLMKSLLAFYKFQQYPTESEI